MFDKLKEVNTMNSSVRSNSRSACGFFLIKRIKRTKKLPFWDRPQKLTEEQLKKMSSCKDLEQTVELLLFINTTKKK